ncbi:MAG: hypothetical protein IJ731_06045 [Eubacterium sp.]|nr:hypothetical protein [Eubacterium sp.]
MRKSISAVSFAILVLVICFFGCSKGEVQEKKTVSASVSQKMETVLNTAEYTLYQNIFFNDMQGEYNGKPAVKQGIFTSIYDSYNGVERYYVWGYNDQTKCCDWQWELKIESNSSLPEKGSLVEVSGTYEVNEKALDKFWIINPKISVKNEYKGNDAEIDMKTMSNTLERVQIANILNSPEYFEGMSICGYGRILDEKTLEDPYYDNSWNIGISGDFEQLAFGTLVEVEGKVKDGAIADCKVSKSTNY